MFSIVVNYNVGSRDERKGRTGFAHLFEHMMFKGSENVGPGEHPYLMFMNGGSMNGTTNKDRTMYFESLPANQLDLALFLDFAKRAGMVGIQEWLSFYWKCPMVTEGLYPEHDLFIQLMKLKNTLRYTQGDELITHLGAEYYD